ncbi:MAG: hypothetical protein ACTSO7_10035, partial [Candidatus Heimdallarchaeota archaeon]
IVHKNGLVDQIFRDRTGLTDQAVGERIFVSKEMNKALKFSVSGITGEIYQRVFDKYFKVKK